MPVSLNNVFLYFFWGLVGGAIAAPFLFVKSAWQAARTSGHYHFRGFHKSKKEYYQRDARMYGALTVLGAVVVVGFFVVL